MKCCENCFSEETLKKRIRDEGELGACDFCCAEDVHTIEPGDLYDEFAGLLALYEPTQYGEHYHPEMGTEAINVGDLLPQKIQEDWGIDIFNYKSLKPDKQCDLLDEIRAASGHYDYKMPGTSSSEFWSLKTKNFTHVSEDELWYGFCEHVKHRRRFIIAEHDTVDPMADPRDWLPKLLESIEKTRPAGMIIYRARPNEIGKSGEPYPAGAMDAPPVEKTISGRVNPAGIRVLYGALERATAVSEVRPEKGAAVTVATLRTKRDLKLADLTSIPPITTPLGHTEEGLMELLARNAFLYCVNEALSRPVRKDEAEIEYVPTQYVAEVIKAAEYDGIIYKSSLAEGGLNIVVFDPSLTEIDPKTELVNVTSVDIKFEAVNPRRILREHP
jgi:RES domain-containing protein